MFQSISITELPKLLGKNNTICIDVRMPSEYKAKHIKGVRNIPLDQIRNYAEELQEYTNVYIHCKTGGRCMQACSTLQDLGLNNIVHIDGSIDELMDSGLLMV